MKKLLLLAFFVSFIPFSTHAISGNSTVFGSGTTNTSIAYFCLNNGCVDNNGNPVTVIIYNAQPQDLSSTFANVNGTIYNKSNNVAYSTPKQFFEASGVTSFTGLTFDTTWTPNSQAGGSNPPVSGNPVTPPVTNNTPPVTQPVSQPVPQTLPPVSAPSSIVTPTCTITLTNTTTPTSIANTGLLTWTTTGITDKGELLESDSTIGGIPQYIDNGAKITPNGSLVVDPNANYKVVFGNTSCATRGQ